MLNECYPVEVSPDFRIFEFISLGIKGSITKVVLYSETDVNGFYNLGFGDKDPTTGFLSDLVVTNNGDSKKVLTTVAATIYLFTGRHKGATVIAQGSTHTRTRLYRTGISNNLAFIEKEFVVYGLFGAMWELFRKNVDYTAFLVRRKL